MPIKRFPKTNREKYYIWPADRLTEVEMAMLFELREQTKMPINHLIRDAILKYCELHQRDKDQDTKTISCGKTIS